MNIRRIATPTLLAIALAGLTACNGQDRNDVNDVNDPANPATSTADPAAQPPGATVDPAMGGDPALSGATGDAGMQGAVQDEAAALGVLNAINEHEIAASEQALAKNVSGEVADYARMMIEQHTENRTRTTALGANADAAPAQAKRQQGEQQLSTLDQQQGDAYSRAYVDAMVKGHGEALAMLDDQLIPAAEREEVRQHLATTREHVATHLEKAQALQQGNAGQSSGQ